MKKLNLFIIIIITLYANSKLLLAQGQVINSPNSNTVCTQNQTCTITWYIWGGTPDIRIQYKIANGSWVTIVDKTSNVGSADSYNWTVPANLAIGSYTIRIGQAQSGGLYYAYWTESSIFQINEADKLQIIQPGGGQYTNGQTLEIEIDANVNYSLQLVNQSNSQSYPADLNANGDLVIHTGFPTGDYKLVATQTSGGSLSDESSLLQISEPIDGVYSLNYVRTKVARVPASTESAFNSLSNSNGNATESITYVDGLGKTRQSISLNSTPSGNHMISSMHYNEIGQQTTSYLAYPSGSANENFKVGSIEAQKRYYENPDNGVTSIQDPYSVTVTEKSPLLTVKEQGAVGTTYQPDGGGRTIKTKTRVNNSTDQVIYWNITSGGDPQGNGYYAVEEISITETTDEDGNVSEVFVNRAGHEVLKRGYLGANKTQPVETYYVYDKFGNLRFIIPPKAVESIGTNSSLTLDEYNTVRNNWLTEMRYDEYQRVIEKKIPEADWVYTVYDNLGRVALTQDGNMRLFNDWFFTKYDIQGRAIITGVYKETEPSRQSRQDMQAHVRSQSMYWEQTELQSGPEFDKKHGYSNHRVFPTGGTENGVIYWSITYYDDYDFNNDGTPDEVFANYPITPSGNNLLPHKHAAFRTDGMVTGSKTRILEQQQIFEDVVAEYGNGHPTEADEVYYMGKQYSNFKITLNPGFRTKPGQKVQMGSFDDVAVPSTVMNAHENGTWLEGVSFYDERGNAIYTKSTNHVGGTDKAWTLFTFDGLVAETITRHTSASENLEIKNRFEYDTQGRLVKEYQKIGTNPELQLTEFTYNEMGQLINKKLVPPAYNENEQNLGFRYHERGWLKSVNDPSSTPIGNDWFEQFFGYELCYDDANECGGTGNLYNGNITAIQWGKPAFIYNHFSGEPNVKTYDYTYDRLSQLTEADFFGGEYTTSFKTQYSYDANGNIVSLFRNQIDYALDDLTYAYNGVGNQITSIDDDHPDGYGAGFDDGAESTLEYEYDLNGNMISDANKGISNITYNYMNLPEVITFSSGNKIVYTYDAAGTKLSQHTYPSGGGAGVSTQYSDGFVYEDNTLAYFPFSEGTVRKVAATWRHEFNLTDHLGNVRLTFYYNDNNEGIILQADDYYPFGMKMGGYSYIASGTAENKFTYNGKELEDEFGLDWYHYGWRFYDSSVGRWWSIDPAEEFHSPYNFVNNNPIIKIDPDGKESNDVINPGNIRRFLNISRKYNSPDYKPDIFIKESSHLVEILETVFDPSNISLDTPKNFKDVGFELLEEMASAILEDVFSDLENKSPMMTEYEDIDIGAYHSSLLITKKNIEVALPIKKRELILAGDYLDNRSGAKGSARYKDNLVDYLGVLTEYEDLVNSLNFINDEIDRVTDPKRIMEIKEPLK
ncbi:MAG: RHS repeat-associated core domain-containing protein [bacterium]|nr:RHS repeat-associated core domain-containing protein [bacterium]